MLERGAVQENWSSNRAFLLAAVGSAVGIGNIWRFPYLVGENGGSAFVLVYVLAVVAVAMPILTAELLMGRRGGRSADETMRLLARAEGRSELWRCHGLLMIAIALLGSSFFSVVSGWCVAYIPLALSGSFVGADAETSARLLQNLTGDPVRMVAWHGVFMGATVLIVSGGVNRGLERALKFLMPTLFILLVVLALYAAVIGDLGAGLRFLFAPDFSRIDADAVLKALGQACLSLSVGVGVMVTYGAYLPKNISIPQRKGYDGTGIDLSDPAHSMTTVARVASYRGFVFASLSAEGPDLETFLGPTRRSLDNVVDRAPSGEVQVMGGSFRVIMRSNWKMVLENLNDLMHPMVAHVSSTEAAEQEQAALPAGVKPPPEIPLLTSNGWPYEFWNGLRVVCCDYGHSLMGGINTPRDTDPVFVSYRHSLEESYGAERTEEILSYPSVMTLIYPSLSVHTAYQQIRVIHPIAVDRTELEVWTLRLKGAQEEMYQRTRVYANLVNSPSSTGNAEDVEAFMRIHQGLKSDPREWVSQHRACGQDRETEGGVLACPGTSEIPMRNQFRAWLGYMTGESGNGR